MAIVEISYLPDGVGKDMYDSVSAAMDTANNPPAGGRVHTYVELDGRSMVIDIWDSPESAERFREERLIPAIKSIVGEEGFAALPDAERSQGEAHDLTIS
jgi:hypothetical protein